MPGGVLGFEPRHVEDVAQRVETVLAREARKLGAQLGDIIRRRRPVHRLTGSSCLESARSLFIARPNRQARRPGR